MNDILDKVKALKASAKANMKDAETEKDDDLFDDALDDLKKARTFLLLEFKSYFDSRNIAINSLQKEYHKKVAFELADCFGMSGGVYRRKGKYREALEMYNKGKEIEENAEFDIPSSYNIVNSIVLRILDNPSSFIIVSNELVPTLDKVKRIVENLGRSNWWSWADYALLLLLNADEQGAFNAYNNFKNVGALKGNYQSTINVLVELRDKLCDINKHVSNLMAKAVEFLEIEKATL